LKAKLSNSLLYAKQLIHSLSISFSTCAYRDVSEC